MSGNISLLHSVFAYLLRTFDLCWNIILLLDRNLEQLDKNEEEKVPLRFTKKLYGFKELTYTDRLIELGLPSLKLYRFWSWQKHLSSSSSTSASHYAHHQLAGMIVSVATPSVTFTPGATIPSFEYCHRIASLNYVFFFWFLLRIIECSSISSTTRGHA